MTREYYAAHLNKRFSIESTLGAVAVQLAAVEGLQFAKNAESFRLLFMGSTEPRLLQGTYLVGLDEAGAEPEAVFLVPVGSASGLTQYEAVFNLG